MKCPRDGSECPVIDCDWIRKYKEHLRQLGFEGTGD